MGNHLLFALLTLVIGAAGGLLFFRLKVPGGMIVGGLITVAALNIATQQAYFPAFGRTITQILAGAYVACTVTREDMKRFPRLVKPYLLVVVSYLMLNLLCGVIIYRITPSISLFTALMCCVPGGMTDIPIIAADMGADVTKVAALQFVRMALGLSIFPALISAFIQHSSSGAVTPRKKERRKGTPREMAVTLLIAGCFGLLGKKSGIPAGTMMFAILSVLAFKLMGGGTYIPIQLRRIAQILTGVYVGTCFTRGNVAELLDMWPAAILLMAGYSLNCILMGFVTSRLTSLNRAEAMLVSTPAGASDMALVAADMGITNPEVSVLHVLRLITVVTVFPHILSAFARLMEGLL
ncbi:MAG: AbrB family transcriptional regulator [Aristaeellaceae bacterium]